MDLNISYFTIAKSVKQTIKEIEKAAQTTGVLFDPNSVAKEMKQAFKMELKLNGKVIKIDQGKPEEQEEVKEGEGKNEGVAIPDELVAKSKRELNTSGRERR